MDLLDRLIGHDAAATRCLLELALPLSDADLDRAFPVGLGTLRRTFVHVVENAETWTDLMDGVDPRVRPVATDESIGALLRRFDVVSVRFARLARSIVDAGRLDDCFVDVLDSPAKDKSFGAGILHIATHGMHHRAQLLFMMRRLGLPHVPEGDALSWEKSAVGGWLKSDH
ncbi:MAG: DinB family protein [Planctomycetota bacterium]